MSSKGYELVQLANGLTVDNSGTVTGLDIDTTGIPSILDIDLAIAPEVLEIQVAAPAAGQDIAWLWTWETSSLPYARRTITNSPELSVPLYKQGTYTINNYAAYDLFGDMTQTHSLYLKWIDSAGTDNLVSWAVDAGNNPVSDSHPDINSGNTTQVQRINVNVPAAITLPTLTPPSVSYTVTNNGAGAYTFSGSAAGDNPNIGPFYRGGTYTFNVSATGHPFYFTTDNGTNFSAGTYFGEYTTGVTGSRTDSGTVTITVPVDAPDTLYYQCGNHGAMRGAITVKDLAVETNINGNYVIYAMHTQEGHKTPIELRPIPSLVNQMCLVFDASSGKFVPQDLATYVENTPSFENKIREVAGTAELVVEDGSAVIAKVNVYDDSTYLPLTGNNAGDQAFATDTDILYIWDGSAWQQAGAANTDDLSEGTTNLFYTDARVGTYLSSNGYDTATNIIASITDSAPVTLDTLNELAAALGDDPNFATTVTTSIADKLPLAGGTLTGTLNGTAANFSGDLTAGNLITTGTVTMDRLALSSSQTTVPPLQLTATALNDGIGALRIDSVEPDIYLNDTNGGFATVTFANADVPRAAFGRNSGDDFYITVRDPGTNSGNWRNNTFIADSSTGNISMGYNLLVTGNVGIGTPTPSQKLDVAGSINLNGSIISESLSPLAIFTGTANSGQTGDARLTIGAKGAGALSGSLATNHTSIMAEYELISSQGSAHLVLDTGGLGKIKLQTDTIIDGNVAIANATSAPNVPTTYDQLYLGDLSQVYNRTGLGLSFSTNNEFGGSPIHKYQSNGTAGLVEMFGNSFKYYNAPTGNAGQTPSWTNRFTINGNGNVGIGTNNPQAKLDVNGLIQGVAGAGTSGGIKLHTNSGINVSANYMSFYTGQTNGFTFNGNSDGADNNNQLVVISGSGNVGIGTTNPGTPLHIDNGNVDGTILRLTNEEVGLNVTVDGGTGNYSGSVRTVTLNATRFDGGDEPALRLAGQDRIEFASDANSVKMTLDKNSGFNNSSQLNLHSTYLRREREKITEWTAFTHCSTPDNANFLHIRTPIITDTASSGNISAYQPVAIEIYGFHNYAAENFHDATVVVNTPSNGSFQVNTRANNNNHSSMTVYRSNNTYNGYNRVCISVPKSGCCCVGALWIRFRWWNGLPTDNYAWGHTGTYSTTDGF